MIAVKSRHFANAIQADIHRCREVGPTTPEHGHDFIEVGYVTGGQGRHVLDHHPCGRLGTGDLFVVQPGHTHFYAETSNLEVMYLLLGTAGLVRSLADMGRSLPCLSLAGPLTPSGSVGPDVLATLHPPRSKSSEIESILHRIQGELRNRVVGYQAMVRALVGELFVDMGRLAVGRGGAAETAGSTCDVNCRRVDAARRVMRRRYAENLTIAAIARHVQIHPQYLCRLFRKHTGQSLLEYLTDIRMEKARQFLAGSALSVTDVCFESGFNDLSHFIRTFRRETGLTPLQFRKKSQ